MQKFAAVIIKFHQVEFPKSWVIGSVSKCKQVGQGSEHSCFSRGSPSLILTLGTWAGRLGGSLLEVVCKCAFTVRTFWCRGLGCLAADSQLLWPTAVYRLPPCLRSAFFLFAAASVKLIVSSSGQPLGREARGWPRVLPAKNDGRLDNPGSDPPLASRKQQIQFPVLLVFHFRRGNSIVI